MVNINGKSWENLEYNDIVEHLKTAESESLFFEYKQDEEMPRGIAKEISAFANTYGGYILIGVSDDSIMGPLSRPKSNEFIVNSY